jgi:hypothetical protein
MGRIFKIDENNNKAELSDKKVMGLFYFGNQPSRFETLIQK